MPAAGILTGKGANIRNLFCTTPKVLKLHETTFWIYSEFMSKRNRSRGPHPIQETGAHPPVGRGLLSPRPPGGPPASIFCYIITFTLEKIVGKLTGRNSAATRRNLGGINLGLWRSCSAGDTSLREGGIITNAITNDPLIGRGSISINIFTSTISSQNPSSSVVSNLVSKPQIGTCGLLIVLITPCS